MPVEFECPHCGALIEQTKKNRELPRIKCTKCQKDFGTQWATKPPDSDLPRGAVVSDRFEQARNFCNKLWNASRFALLNLDGYTAAPVATKDLAIEDRWLLSRLSTVTAGVTQALEEYRYADSARFLYEFAWDEFCSFYIEMVKGRLQDPLQRATAQRVLAHALDTLLRLLHPMIPFLTEEVWQLLGQAAHERGLGAPKPAAASVMMADWPHSDTAWQDREIEVRFARFQEVLRGLREVRSRQNIDAKTPISFAARCSAETVELLRPMAPYFESMAGARASDWGPSVQPPKTHAAFNFPGIEVYVDLAGLIDVAAEITKNEKERSRLADQISAKEKKLANASFVERAPSDVVQRERESLAQLTAQLAAIEAALLELRQS
jgi:valyl-tRNA synthetase